MTNNPFEQLGAGGLDMGALLAQAQAMQAQMQQAQANLADAQFDGEVAGVKVVVSGVGDLVGVELNPAAVPGANAEDLAELGDIIVAAYRVAREQADQVAKAAMGAVSGGMGEALGMSVPE